MHPSRPTHTITEMNDDHARAASSIADLSLSPTSSDDFPSSPAMPETLYVVLPSEVTLRVCPHICAQTPSPTAVNALIHAFCSEHLLPLNYEVRLLTHRVPSFPHAAVSVFHVYSPALWPWYVAHHLYWPRVGSELCLDTTYIPPEWHTQMLLQAMVDVLGASADLCSFFDARQQYIDMQISTLEAAHSAPETPLTSHRLRGDTSESCASSAPPPPSSTRLCDVLASAPPVYLSLDDVPDEHTHALSSARIELIPSAPSLHGVVMCLAPVPNLAERAPRRSRRRRIAVVVPSCLNAHSTQTLSPTPSRLPACLTASQPCRTARRAFPKRSRRLPLALALLGARLLQDALPARSRRRLDRATLSFAFKPP